MEEKMFKVRLIFNEEEVEIDLNSDYEYFINSICNILKISIEQFSFISLSYTDNEGDNIILSSLEDYNIFFQQVSHEQVDNFRISIKENSDLDQNECLINLLNYKENFEIENNNDIINNNIYNNINNEDENYFDVSRKNQYIEQNNKNNINYNINNILSKEYYYNNINDNKYELDKKINEDIPINNLIFEYQCSFCKKYPILCKIFYCAKCSFYLCQECERNDVKHEHNLLRIDSKEELRKIKDKENEEIDKNIKENEKINEQNLRQNYPNYNINNNNQYDFQSNIDSNLGYRQEKNRRFYYINSQNMNNNHYNYNPYFPAFYNNCNSYQNYYYSHYK